MRDNMEKYKENYSDRALFKKLKSYAKVAGYEVIETVLKLYYAMQKPEIPTKAKAVIIGALGYFIFPIDLIPDLLPVVGYGDDLTVLAGAVTVVASYIDKDVKEKAKAKMKDWFD
ncbi:MAG: YkvA family protein [Campylobacterota bacterium]|nr:YkvA family protein [Campylobacterota bacterium]